MNLYVWVYYIAQFFLIRETLGPGGAISTWFKFSLRGVSTQSNLFDDRFPVFHWMCLLGMCTPSENLVSAHHLEISTRFHGGFIWIYHPATGALTKKDRAGSGNESPQRINRSVIVVMDNPPFLDEWNIELCMMNVPWMSRFQFIFAHLQEIIGDQLATLPPLDFTKWLCPSHQWTCEARAPWSVWPLVKTDQISSVNIIRWLVNGCSFQVLRNKTR